MCIRDSVKDDLRDEMEKIRNLMLDTGNGQKIPLNYVAEVRFDAADIEPMITYGTNPGMGMGITQHIPATEGMGEAAKEMSIRDRNNTPNYIPLSLRSFVLLSKK